MPKASSASKAKIARRVVEVLDFFDDANREATVMDIARRYRRPQSSTSDLLASLVELGLLYRDPNSRCYGLTPRAALLGASGQIGPLRDGRLMGLIDRLVAQTGLSVAVFGRVELNVQIVSWHPGARAIASEVRGIGAGQQEPMSENAAGLLLLSTLGINRRSAVLRRLNAEASENRKFSVPTMDALLNDYLASGEASGKLGFGSRAELVAALLPSLDKRHPLAIGIAFGESDRVSPGSLRYCLSDALAGLSAAEEASEPPRVAFL